MMTETLKEVVIESRNYGDYDGVIIYLTSDLHEKLKNSPTPDGQTQLDKMATGKAMQGMKHLIASIKEKSNDAKIILTFGRTKIDNGSYYVDYNDYKKHAGSRFFDLYKETGYSAARSYLNKYFPDEFEYDANALQESEKKRAEKQQDPVYSGGY